MKDHSKNIFIGKNIKKNQKNSGSNFHSEKSNQSKKENNFLINSPKSKRSNYLNELNRKKSNFSSSKRRNLTNKSTKDFSYNSRDNKFELVEYQDEVRDDIIKKIIEEIIIYLSI